MSFKEFTEKINRLKREKKAVILAHNYQLPEVQDIADYVGDSIELGRRAREEEEAKILVVSAVDFMAESAALLNPDKKVLLPSRYANCPMAEMLQIEDIKLWRRRYPGIPIVLYVNTHAEAKARCDVCCTSANAVEVVNALDSDTVIFGPDYNLVEYVQQNTDKKIIPIPERGFCLAHVLFVKEDILILKEKYPEALVLVHPECTLEVQQIADFIGSTSQILRYVKRTTKARKFIIGTEDGIIHRLQKENPGREFITAHKEAICPGMKINTLRLIYLSLREERYPITIPKPIAPKARRALEKMFEITS
jgi:quinolinate synthase